MLIAVFLGDLVVIPVAAISGKGSLFIGLQGNGEKELGKPPETHFLHAAIGGLDAPGDYAEAVPSDLLAQHVVLGEQGVLTEPAETHERRPVEDHEHPGRERYSEEPGAPLAGVADGKSEHGFRIIRAMDVRRNAVQSLDSHLVDRHAYQFGVLKLHIGVEKQEVTTGRQSCPGVASHSGQTAFDDRQVQPKLQRRDRRREARTVVRPGVGEDDRNLVRLNVVLLSYRFQQFPDVGSLVLCRNDDRQFGIHAAQRARPSERCTCRPRPSNLRCCSSVCHL